VVQRGAKRRRSRSSEIWPREQIKVVEGVSWTCGRAKKRHGELEQLLSTGGATWRLRVAAEQRGTCGRRQRGGAEAVAKLPGDAWSGAEAGASLGRRGNSGQQWRCCGGRGNKGGRKGRVDPRVLSLITGTTGTSL
jgi:hypothetical protein